MRAKNVFWDFGDNDGEKSVLVTFRIDKGRLKVLDEFSKNECISRSFCIRQIIQRFVDTQIREYYGLNQNNIIKSENCDIMDNS